MTDAEWLRDQAERRLRLAQSATDPQQADRLKTLAADYLERVRGLWSECPLHDSSRRPARDNSPPQRRHQIQPKKEEN
jgi:hypothetical protein